VSDIRLDSAVTVDWPDARWNTLHGSVGVVISQGGVCRDVQGVSDRLWHVRVEGY
jgi:hypothetical protein